MSNQMNVTCNICGFLLQGILGGVFLYELYFWLVYWLPLCVQAMAIGFHLRKFYPEVYRTKYTLTIRNAMRLMAARRLPSIRDVWFIEFIESDLVAHDAVLARLDTQLMQANSRLELALRTLLLVTKRAAVASIILVVIGLISMFFN